MARLYELTDAYAGLYAQLDDCSTLDEAAEVLAQLDALETDIADKASNYAKMLKNLDSEANAYAGEIKRLQERKRVAEKAIDRLKDNMRFAMGIAGATEIATPIGKWRIAKNPPSVQITDAGAVPERFLIPQPPEVDKRAILKAYKETGELFDGVEIVQTEGARFR